MCEELVQFADSEITCPVTVPRPSHLLARWAVLLGDYRLVDVKVKIALEDGSVGWTGELSKKWKWCPSGTKLYRAVSLPFGLAGVVILLGCMAAMVWMLLLHPEQLAKIKNLPVSFTEMSAFAVSLTLNAGMAQYWSRKKSGGSVPLHPQASPVQPQQYPRPM